ncbi:MAG: hypothetical protein DRJ36_02520 [Thermoprotei archaeon]|nr:MAG: hypothetical protein DRJ36_02520 [Thermoprotei archaeon]
MVIDHSYWRRIVSSIERIVKAGCYTKVNRVISLTLDSYLRDLTGKIVRGYRTILDSGCGPGLLLDKLPDNEVICLDPSLTLLKLSKDKHKLSHHICGVAEAIPLRDHSVDAITSLFSFRDFIDREKAANEYMRVVRSRIVIVDLFKPANPGLRLVAAMYLSYIAPLIAMGIAGKIGSEWRQLYKTYLEMITLNTLREIFRDFKQEVAVSFLGGFLSLIDLTRIKNKS